MRMRLLALVLLCPSALAAQAPSPLTRCVAQADSAAPAAALDTCRQALAYYAPLDSTAILARIRFALGDIHRALKQPDSAVVHFTLARELYDRAGSRAAAGTSRGRAGSAHFEADRPDSAQAAFTEALGIARALGDSANQAAFSRWLGFLARRRGARDTALVHYRESLALYTARGHAANVRWLNRELGEVHALLRQPDSAITYLEAALAPGPAPADSATEARTLRQLADLYVESAAPDSLIWARRGALALRAAGTGQPDSAAALLAARARATTDSATAAGALAWLGMVEHARRRPGAAITAYRAAIAASPAGAPRKPVGVLHSVLGTLFEREGRLDSMGVHYRAAAAAGVSTVTPPAFAWLDRGRRLVAAGQLDSAIASFEAAIRLFEAVGSQGLRNIVRLNILTTYRDAGQLDSALAVGHRLIADWRRLGVPGEEALIWMTVASIHFERAEFDTVIATATHGLAIAPPDVEPRVLATLHGTRGTALALTGRYEEAVRDHRASVAAWGRAGTGHRADAARATGHLGSVFRQMGQVDSALSYHRLARGMVQEGTSGELLVLRDLAYDFEAAGLRDSALGYHRARRDAARWRRDHTTSDPDGDALAESESLDRIGLLLRDRGDAAGADSAFRAALESYTRGARQWDEASVLGDIATLYERLGQSDSALTLHRRGLARAIATGRTSDRVRSLSAIGRLETRAGNSTAGLAALREAAAIQRSRGAIETSAAILANLAYTMRRLPQPDLPGALALLDSAAVLRAQVRAQAGADDYRLGVQELTTLPTGEWELAWLQHGGTVGAEPAAFASLAAAERGRAQALLDLMRGTARAARAGADLTAEGRRLVGAAAAGGAGVLSYLVTADTLLIWYARPLPGRAGRVQLTATRVAVGADSLARLAARWRAALGVDQVDVGARLAGDAAPALEERLRTGVAAAAAAGGDPARIGAELAALLLPAELREGGRVPAELVIVPHGVLTVIPFGALPLGESALGLRVALRQAPSLASLAEVERRPAAPGGAARARRFRDALVVGDPRMPTLRGADGGALTLRPLPAAAVEGDSVARRVGVRALTGAAATETEVRRRMARAPLVHLATHGYAYAAAGRARNSFVALAADSMADGLLTVGEVLDDPSLRLGAELVVLSACQTGLGNLAQAEGTVGLQRAFLARGARRLLVSLWSVSDDATAILMQRFYAHWLDDRDQPTPAEALRRAQVDVRNTPGFEAPRYWAPFMVVGGR
ncbi:MAG: CHAT domain-containing tetratricopeptide repeat protein [Gemmatimonadales bacterium]